MSQQGCNCGFGLAAAVSEDMILADTNPIAHCVDTRHHFPASVVPDTLPFPFLHSSLTHKKPPSVHTVETCQCSPAGTAVHRGPCWGFRTAWPPASPLLMVLILCEVPKAQATVDGQDRSRNTHTHAHARSHMVHKKIVFHHKQAVWCASLYSLSASLSRRFSRRSGGWSWASFILPQAVKTPGSPPGSRGSSVLPTWRLTAAGIE